MKVKTRTNRIAVLSVLLISACAVAAAPEQKKPVIKGAAQSETERAEQIISLINGSMADAKTVDGVLDDFAVLAKAGPKTTRNEKAAIYIASLWKFHYENQKRVALAKKEADFNAAYSLSPPKE